MPAVPDTGCGEAVLHPPGIRRSHPYPHKVSSMLLSEYWLWPMLYTAKQLRCGKAGRFCELQYQGFHCAAFFFFQASSKIRQLDFPFQIKVDAAKEPYGKSVS